MHDIRRRTVCEYRARIHFCMSTRSAKIFPLIIGRRSSYTVKPTLATVVSVQILIRKQRLTFQVIMSVRWGYERFQMPQTALDMFRGSQAPSDHTDETTNDHFAQSQPISDLLLPHTVLGGEKSAVKLESDEADQTQQTRTSATGNFLNGTSAAARFLNTVEADQNIAERSALLNAVELSEIPPSSQVEMMYDESYSIAEIIQD